MLGMTASQSGRVPFTGGTRLLWTRFAIGATFGLAILLAAFSLVTLTQHLDGTALSLTGMSLSASLFGFALYYVRPKVRAPRQTETPQRLEAARRSVLRQLHSRVHPLHQLGGACGSVTDLLGLQERPASVGKHA